MIGVKHPTVVLCCALSHLIPDEVHECFAGQDLHLFLPMPQQDLDHAEGACSKEGPAFTGCKTRRTSYTTAGGFMLRTTDELSLAL